VIFLTIIIGGKFLAPISWREIRILREWNEPPQNEVRCAGDPKKPAASQNTLSATFPPRDHLLTGGFANSQEAVMTITPRIAADPIHGI
jgi:hypothetical protein